MFKSVVIQHVCFRNTLGYVQLKYGTHNVVFRTATISPLFQFFLCSRLIREIKRVSCSVSGRYFEHFETMELATDNSR